MQNFIWVPLAVYMGKRPVFVASCIIVLFSHIWAASATSFKSLLAATLFTAFGGGATEALGAAIVNVRLNYSLLRPKVLTS
jgi:predicted MFS family arabinose efflux permease